MHDVVVGSLRAHEGSAGEHGTAAGRDSAPQTLGVHDAASFRVGSDAQPDRCYVVCLCARARACVTCVRAHTPGGVRRVRRHEPRAHRRAGSLCIHLAGVQCACVLASIRRPLACTCLRHGVQVTLMTLTLLLLTCARYVMQAGANERKKFTFQFYDFDGASRHRGVRTRLSLLRRATMCPPWAVTLTDTPGTRLRSLHVHGATTS